MKLNELFITEEPLQKIVKRLMKPAGTISRVMGRDAEAAATLLQGKAGDSAFVIKGGSPQNDSILKSVGNSRSHEESTSDDHGKLRSVRMSGGAKILVVGTGEDMFLLTSEHQRDQLVESTEEADQG